MSITKFCNDGCGVEIFSQSSLLESWKETGFGEWERHERAMKPSKSRHNRELDVARCFQPL